MKRDPFCECGYRKSLHPNLPSNSCKEMFGGFRESAGLNLLLTDDVETTQMELE